MSGFAAVIITKRVSMLYGRAITEAQTTVRASHDESPPRLAGFGEVRDRWRIECSDVFCADALHQWAESAPEAVAQHCREAHGVEVIL